MQVKIFTGGSTQEVMAKIKAELGSDAVILDSKNFQENGVKQVRMTAALDRIDPPVTPASPMSSLPSEGGRLSMLAGAGGQWTHEWQNIKKQLFALMKPALQLDKLEERQRSAMEFLEQEGASDQVLLELYRRLFDAPRRSVLEPLAELMPVKPWGLEEWPQRVHLIAGPFGAGKTTSVVRMALALQKAGAGSICIVNADAERGNGRLLLKHYAGLSGLSYREASTSMEMAGVMSEISSQGFDRVMVDLPGVAMGRHLADILAELALDRMEEAPFALHLVFSPYYSPDMQTRFLNRYRLTVPASIIWSKLDECGQFGSMLNLAVASGLPASCFSFGAGLLNTLVPARQSALWRILFKHEIPTAPMTAVYE